VREYARTHGGVAEEAIIVVMAEKSKEFLEAGAKVYQPG
jgi:hypothetical protein